MAYEQPDFLIGCFKADTDMSSVAANQYTGVALGKAANITGTGMGNAAIVVATPGSGIIGVLQNNPLQNEAATVCNTGITMAKVSGSGAVGDLMAVDANGFFVKATSGQSAVGMMLEDYTAGATSSMLLGSFGKQ